MSTNAIQPKQCTERPTSLQRNPWQLLLLVDIVGLFFFCGAYTVAAHHAVRFMPRVVVVCFSTPTVNCSGASRLSRLRKGRYKLPPLVRQSIWSALPRPHSLSRRQPVADAHACTLHRCLPVFRQIEQPSEEDAASLTAALLAVEGAVLAEEVLASRLAARRTRFHSGAQLLQVRLRNPRTLVPQVLAAAGG